MWREIRKEYTEYCAAVNSYTYEEREYEEYVWNKEDISTVGFLKVTLFPSHSFVSGVTGEIGSVICVCY